MKIGSPPSWMEREAKILGSERLGPREGEESPVYMDVCSPYPEAMSATEALNRVFAKGVVIPKHLRLNALYGKFAGGRNPLLPEG